MSKSLRWSTAVLFVAVTGIPLLVANCTSYDPSENGQQVLSTLASIQAAVFAIVFSVVILGIQLSTSRYSPRLANLFRSDRGYKKTVGIFAASLGVDIIGLLAFTHVSSSVLRFVIALALCLAVTSFAVLYFFVDRTLEQTTPEGIIDRIKQELTPDQIIFDAKAAQNDNSVIDPFLVPVSIIRSAIDDRDLPAATLGLNLIGTQVEKLLKHVSTDQVKKNTSVGNSLEELSTNRLPNVGEKSVDEDLPEAGIETVNTISSIGNSAIKQDHEPVVLYTSQGLSRLVADVGFDSTSETIREEAMDESGAILKDAAEAKLWDTAGTGIRTLGWRSAQSIVKRGPTEQFERPYISLSIDYIPKLLEKVVEGIPNDVDDENIVQGVPIRDGDHAVSPEEWALSGCYVAMSEVTSALIRYEVQHSEEIVHWMSIGTGWYECVVTLNNSGFDLLLRYWLGTILYLQYIQSELANQYMDDFRPPIRSIVPAEVLDQTFEDILSEDLDPTSRIDLLPGRFNPVEAPQTGYPIPPVSDPDYSFEEWCEFNKGLGRMSGNWGSGPNTTEESDEDED